VAGRAFGIDGAGGELASWDRSVLVRGVEASIASVRDGAQLLAGLRRAGSRGGMSPHIFPWLMHYETGGTFAAVAGEVEGKHARRGHRRRGGHAPESATSGVVL